MKQIAKTVLKGLLVIVLFTGGSIALSTIGVKTVNQANATVSYQQVYDYLVANGYTVFTLEPKPGTKYDWIAHTATHGVHYWTTVHCTANEIVTHEDAPL